MASSSINSLKRLKSFSSRLALNLVNKLKGPNPNPVIVFGHQKSGTTAIAQLLGKATSKSVGIDPFYHLPNKQSELPALYANQHLLKKLIRKNRVLYFADIIKDPEFSYFYDELFGRTCCK